MALIFPFHSITQRMQGNLRIICVHIETSSLWAEFVNKNRCISVRLVSEEAKSIKFG